MPLGAGPLANPVAAAAWVLAPTLLIAGIVLPAAEHPDGGVGPPAVAPTTVRVDPGESASRPGQPSGQVMPAVGPTTTARPEPSTTGAKPVGDLPLLDGSPAPPALPTMLGPLVSGLPVPPAGLPPVLPALPPPGTLGGPAQPG